MTNQEFKNKLDQMRQPITWVETSMVTGIKTIRSTAEFNKSVCCEKNTQVIKIEITLTN
jgi:hypothetical protein